MSVSVFTTGLDTPWGMAFDGENNMYVVDESVNIIYKVLPNGTKSIFVSAITGPQNCAFNSVGFPSGNLYVRYDANFIAEINSSGTIVSLTAITIFPSFYGLTFDENDFLYYPDNNDNNVFSNRNSSNPTIAQTLFITGTGTLSQPTAMAVDVEGNFYISNAANNSIASYTNNGVLINPSIIQTPNSTWYWSNVIYFDGTIYGSFSNGIGTYFINSYNAYNGDLIAEIYSSSSAINGMATDSVGNLYFSSGSQVFKYTLPLPPPPPPPPPIEPDGTIYSHICFVKGTPVNTDSGIIAINDLKCGVHKIHGMHIKAITQTLLPKGDDGYLIMFKQNALGADLPLKDTIMSKNHKIMYTGQMFDAECFLLKWKDVIKVPYNGELLYNVLLEEYDVMVINNLIVETLHPSNPVAKLYNQSQVKTKTNIDIHNAIMAATATTAATAKKNSRFNIYKSIKSDAVHNMYESDKRKNMRMML